MSEGKFNKPGEVALQQAARKAALDPFFLGSALKIYQEKEHKDDKALAALLEIEPEELPRLALCRRPDTKNQAIFRRDLTLIAQRFGIAPLVLANLLRRVDAFEAHGQTQSYLMAARDHEEDELEEEGQPEDA